MENFSISNFGQIMKALKSPQVKQLIATVQLFAKILPHPETQEVEIEGKEYLAVLFSYSDENVRRVQAIGNVFEDILPPFKVRECLDVDGKLYSAILFSLNSEQGKNAR